MLVYNLTPLLRGAAEQRRVMIQGFEVRHRMLVIAIASFPIGVLLAVLLYPLLGGYSLLALPLALGGMTMLFDGRSSRGMNLRRYRTIWNKSTSNNGVFLVNGQPYDPLADRFMILVPSSAPGRRPASSAESVIDGAVLDRRAGEQTVVASGEHAWDEEPVPSA